MAIDKEIDAGLKLLSNSKFEEAVIHFDNALKENPKAFKAHYQKSIALHRLQRYDEAEVSLGYAQTIAKDRGKREMLSSVLFRLSLVYFKKEEYQKAIKYLNTAKSFGHDEKDISVWIHQINEKAKTLNLALNKTEEFKDLNEIPTIKLVTTTPSKDSKDDSSNNAEKENLELEEKTKNKIPEYPKFKDIKRDWYQTNDNVTISVFIKNLPKDDTLKVNFSKNGVSFAFPTSPSSEFQYDISPLFKEIDTSNSNYQVYSSKIEFNLKKSISAKWASLEAIKEPETVCSSLSSANKVPQPLQYPTSSQKHVDWGSLNIDDEEEEKGENAFFRSLYKNSDDDSKRAMLKSYLESNGTVLSTSWDEVSQKTYETVPPDGLEAKKW